jgi:hypothetical protein
MKTRLAVDLVLDDAGFVPGPIDIDPPIEDPPALHLVPQIERSACEPAGYIEPSP